MRSRPLAPCQWWHAQRPVAYPHHCGDFNPLLAIIWLMTIAYMTAIAVYPPCEHWRTLMCFSSPCLSYTRYSSVAPHVHRAGWLTPACSIRVDLAIPREARENSRRRRVQQVSEQWHYCRLRTAIMSEHNGVLEVSARAEYEAWATSLRVSVNWRKLRGKEEPRMLWCLTSGGCLLQGRRDPRLRECGARGAVSRLVSAGPMVEAGLRASRSGDLEVRAREH